MKTNTKLNLLTALTLALLPMVAMAAGTTAPHVATFTPRQVNVGSPFRPQANPVMFKNALQFNEVDGQPVR
jgi:hypothetical protein